MVQGYRSEWLCHRLATTAGNPVADAGPSEWDAEHPNRPASLTKTPKTAPRLKFSRVPVGQFESRWGRNFNFETVGAGGPEDRPDPAGGVLGRARR
jgi:hypothetical protein